MDKAQFVYKITSLIPKGKVLTYGKLAKLADVKSARFVGTVLHKNIDPEEVPCHRVVTSNGRVAANYAFGGAKVQKQRLLSEDVTFIKNRINLSKHLWNPDLDSAD